MNPTKLVNKPTNATWKGICPNNLAVRNPHSMTSKLKPFLTLCPSRYRCLYEKRHVQSLSESHQSLRSYNNDGDSASYISNNSNRWLLLCHHYWKTQMNITEHYFQDNNWGLPCNPHQETNSWGEEKIRWGGIWLKNLQTSCKAAAPQQASSHHNTKPATAGCWGAPVEQISAAADESEGT